MVLSRLTVRKSKTEMKKENKKVFQKTSFRASSHG
jgi:hypothetical protein